MKCRFCSNILEITFVDLGTAPLSNAYLCAQSLRIPEKWYPLKILLCSHCWLVQTQDHAQPEEIFSSNYAYLSSCSTSWLEHSKNYAENIVVSLGLNENSLVGEVACNDGYLLQYFKKLNIPCFGIEPTISTAQIAKEKGLHIFNKFFSDEFAFELKKNNYSADLLIANNVLAHVPNINDFVKGFTQLLKPKGVASFEFPHLYNLISKFQFDTIYHEHFSYLSFTAVISILHHNGLNIFNVEKIDTHGGSLRVYAQRNDTGQRTVTKAVNELLTFEQNKGIKNLLFYSKYQSNIINIKSKFLNFLLTIHEKKETVVGYGAAAKASTLLNFCGVRNDLIDYVVDKNFIKQGQYLPGSRIPILSDEILVKNKPKWIIIFPWNLHKEISSQLSYVKEWGAKFITVIPELKIF